LVRSRITQTSIFPLFRTSSNNLSVRAGSTRYSSGGTLHRVTHGFYHGSYNPRNHDYDVAVLRVCTDLDIAIDISKYVMCLQWYVAYVILPFMQWWFCNSSVQNAAAVTQTCCGYENLTLNLSSNNCVLNIETSRSEKV